MTTMSRVAALEADLGSTDGTLDARISSIIDTTGARVMVFAAGAATPVNYITARNNSADGAVSLRADGGGTDIPINLIPKGAGKLTENGTAVALASGAAPANSVAGTVGALVTDFNALLAALRTARVIDAP